MEQWKLSGPKKPGKEFNVISESSPSAPRFNFSITWWRTLPTRLAVYNNAFSFVDKLRGETGNRTHKWADSSMNGRAIYEIHSSVDRSHQLTSTGTTGNQAIVPSAFKTGLRRWPDIYDRNYMKSTALYLSENFDKKYGATTRKYVKLLFRGLLKAFLWVYHPQFGGSWSNNTAALL